MAGDAGLLETRKLVSGVICLWLASADVERFPLEPATLRHWCSILLGVITGPGSDDEDAAVFIWKAKARCFRSWSSIIRAVGSLGALIGQSAPFNPPPPRLPPTRVISTITYPPSTSPGSMCSKLT